MARWQRNYGPELAHAIAAANGREPALDLTVKADPAHWAERARRQRAADRLGARHRARTGAALARLRRRRVVGAGRRRGAAGAASRRRARQVGRRPLRRARRQDRAARRRRRPRHRGRPLRSRGSSGLRQNLTRLGLDAETVAADVTRMAGGAVRRGAARRALLVDRHHPPPSRHPLAQARSGHRDARRPAAPAARARGRADAARRHARLLHLLARAGGGQRDRGGTAGRRFSRCGGVRSRRARSTASPSSSTATGDLRTLPCHLPDSDPQMAASTASTRPGWSACDGSRRLAAVTPFAMVRPRDEGTPAREGANASMSRVSVAERTRLSAFLARGMARRLLGRADRALARPPAVPSRRARPPPDRTAGPAHDRFDPRERDLRRPLLPSAARW